MIFQACGSRDSLSMALYSQLFRWIISKINQRINGPEDFHFIGILDIFGFENFEVSVIAELATVPIDSSCFSQKKVTSAGYHLRGFAPEQLSSEETSQQWQAIGDTAPNFTDLRIENPLRIICHYHLANPLVSMNLIMLEM